MDWTKKEEHVIEKIFEDISSISNVISMALWTTFSGRDEHPYRQDILVALGVHRTELDLLPELKPGDIDILIVPYNGKPMLEKILAIEVKVVRPTIEKPSKNASSMGITQAKGLLRDGFPYVGLIHILLPESLPEEDLVLIPEALMQLDDNGELKMTGYAVPIDLFPIACARRQNGRIQALELPHEISFSAIGISIKNNELIGYTQGDGRIGQMNNMPSLDLMNRIERLLEDKPELFRLIKWYS